jgi:hypothetical protein
VVIPEGQAAPLAFEFRAVAILARRFAKFFQRFEIAGLARSGFGAGTFLRRHPSLGVVVCL